MKNPARVLFAIAVLACAAAAALPAQSLLDNDYYYKARDLQYQSEVALNSGEYDKAVTLAAQAREYLAKSDAYVEEMTRFYRANGWLSVANDRVAYAKSISADVNFKDAYLLAVSDVHGAQATLDAKEYETSVGLSKAAIEALKGISVVQAPAVEPPKPVEPPKLAEPSWPQYYTVRLIPTRRDCFWRIAEYPFVYNDPWKWKLLYEANKSLLPNPANPDLIEPGQVFEIPSLAGEKREGTWDPNVTYPPLP
jgi:nucleoid-associated protein YgaU